LANLGARYQNQTQPRRPAKIVPRKRTVEGAFFNTSTCGLLLAVSGRHWITRRTERHEKWIQRNSTKTPRNPTSDDHFAQTRAVFGSRFARSANSGFVESLDEILGPKVRVSAEHLHRLVARDRSGFLIA
jgi:hypothetical protein